MSANQAVSFARRSVVLVFLDEAFVNRNRIIPKLEACGCLVKRSIVIDSVEKADLSPYDAVVAIIDHFSEATSMKLANACRRANKTLFRLPHQRATKEWQTFSEWASQPSSRIDVEVPRASGKVVKRLELPTPLPLMESPSPASKPVAPEELEELAAAYANDATDLKREVSRLKEELHKAVERATKAEAERDEAREKFIHAARGLDDMVKADTKVSNKLKTTESKLHETEKVVDEQKKELNKLRKQLEDKDKEFQALEQERNSLQLDVERLGIEKDRFSRELNVKTGELNSVLKRKPGVDAEVIDALASLVAKRLMSTEEAFEKLREAAR